MVTYDKNYQEENLFGKPYKGLIDFFKNYEPKGKILDLGCGQGRDSIPLARMGYQVTGVDISKVGVNQMLEDAKNLGLKINGVVEDLYQFEIIKEYDIILLDSLFHFEKKDKEKESKFLENVMKQMKFGGILCIFVWKSKRIEKSLIEILKNSEQEWETLEDKYVDYPEQNMQYRMLIIKKLSSKRIS